MKFYLHLFRWSVLKTLIWFDGASIIIILSYSTNDTFYRFRFTHHFAIKIGIENWHFHTKFCKFFLVFYLKDLIYREKTEATTTKCDFISFDYIVWFSAFNKQTNILSSCILRCNLVKKEIVHSSKWRYDYLWFVQLEFNQRTSMLTIQWKYFFHLLAIK